MKSYNDLDNKLDGFDEKTFDILDTIYKTIAFRVSLNDVSKQTLNKSKRGNGKEAVHLFRSCAFEELIEYCAHDVYLTRLLFEYIEKHGKLYYSANYEKQSILLQILGYTNPKTMNLENSKLWFNGYFESLLLSDSITQKQIRFLKEKVDNLFDQIEESNQESDEDENEIELNMDDSITYLNQINQPPKNNNKASNTSTLFEDSSDDLPF